MFPGKKSRSLNNMIDRQKRGLTRLWMVLFTLVDQPGAGGVEKVSAYAPAIVGMILSLSALLWTRVICMYLWKKAP